MNLPEWMERDGAGTHRHATIHSMLRRLNGWDYRGRAIYQITVVLADRSSATLGRLEVRRNGSPENGRAQDCPVQSRSRDDGWLPVNEAARLGLAPDAVEARVTASAFGKAALEALEEMPRRYPQVEILARQVMPDHIHFVAFVKSPIDRPFGALVRGFKAGAAKRWRALAGSDANGVPAWAEGFQDTVLLHEGQLANMKLYLADNPRRLAVKRLFPGLFRVVGELALPLVWGERRLVGHFAALGNRFLLNRQLVQVQVSRRDFVYQRTNKPGGGLKISHDADGEPIPDFASPAFDEKKTSLFAAAKHGAVLISPCVSDGERQIAREALAAGFPLITIQNKGFSPIQKPSGRYFDACADGRLLMLAPVAWPYQQGEKSMTRFCATAMNRLCQGIVGETAADVNYHGMQPSNIDELAIAAAQAVEILKPKEKYNYESTHSTQARAWL